MALTSVKDWSTAAIRPPGNQSSCFDKVLSDLPNISLFLCSVLFKCHVTIYYHQLEFHKCIDVSVTIIALIKRFCMTCISEKGQGVVSLFGQIGCKMMFVVNWSTEDEFTLVIHVNIAHPV